MSVDPLFFGACAETYFIGHFYHLSCPPNVQIVISYHIIANTNFLYCNYIL